MTVSSIKVRLPSKFPSSVTATSPLVLTQTGGSFAFTFDVTALHTSFDPLYLQSTNNLSDVAFPYTAKDNISKHGADIASATTVNLETATGDLVDVTGTVTITAITLSEGHERTVRFTGALTLTNGASLVLPGGANITTAAGDYAVFRGYAAGVVRCVTYIPKTGKAVIFPAITDITGLGSGVAVGLGSAATGSGGPVLTTSPTLVTPTLGVATATTYNKVTITAPASAATLTLIDGTVLTGPAATDTLVGRASTDTFTGVKTFGAAGNVGKLAIAGTTSGSTVLNATAVASGTLTLPAATDTLVGKATADTLTNKTFNSTGTGNVLQVSGVTVSAGQFPGETTTGSATAGNIGEYIETVVAVGSAVSLVTGTAKDIATLTLSAGDWDISAEISFVTAATTSVTNVFASISATLNTTDQTVGRISGGFFPATVPTASNTAWNVPVGPVRFSISGSTTYHLVALATFTVSTLTGYGIIRARRMR